MICSGNNILFLISVGIQAALQDLKLHVTCRIMDVSVNHTVKFNIQKQKLTKVSVEILHIAQEILRWIVSSRGAKGELASSQNET